MSRKVLKELMMMKKRVTTIDTHALNQVQNFLLDYASSCPKNRFHKLIRICTLKLMVKLYDL